MINGNKDRNGIKKQLVDETNSKEKSYSIEKMTVDKKRKVIDNDFSESKRNKLETKLYKPPTAQELFQLKETQNLFHSELFRLQIEEVLSAIKLKNKYKNQFENWFEKFKNEINGIKERTDICLENILLLRNRKEKLKNDCKGSINFLPPSNITLGGSYLLNTTIGPNVIVDIFVEMPRNIFQKTDCKNYRYMHKKAMYLTVIASNISNQLAKSKSFIGNNLCPILKIIPIDNLDKYITVHVHVTVEETTFQLNKLTPDKNNIKPDWYFKDNSKKKFEISAPTTLYNNIIMQDLTTLKSNINYINEVNKHVGVRDGIILLKIWLRQRELGDCLQSFNGHIITMFVLYLLQSKKVYNFMTAYQIVRNTWYHLANDKWYKDGITFCQDEKIKERILLYQKYYDCVFLDVTGFHNITANISGDVCQWISCQAKMALDCLNNNRSNSFQVLFMRKIPFYTRFDHIICVHNTRAVGNILQVVSSAEDELNYHCNERLQAIKLISSTLKEGLKSRISFIIDDVPCKIKEWDLADEAPNSLDKFFIGIQLNPDSAFDIVDKGPEANLPEASEFRKFWGKKSELRRFKDARICETVVWAKEDATLADKRNIPRIIIKYLLEEKLKLFEKSHYFIISNQMEEFLKLNNVIVPKFRYGMEEVAHRAISVFDELKTELCSLTELPLSIHGVQGCSPVFRYTEVFPPLGLIRRANSGRTTIEDQESQQLLFTADNSTFQEAPTYLGLVEATMQLSLSGRWPDELEALRMTKAAFYLQIADCLRKQHKLQARGSRHYIDIAKRGLVFRIRIAHQREISLAKQIVDEEDGLIKYRENEESMELEMNLFQLPKLTGALYGLYSQQPSFGPACCLAKRWLSAHLIDYYHMPNIVVELLLASIYLNPEPYSPAQAPQVAFLRFLESFANQHWTNDPIIINFNKEMSADEILEVENFFGTHRDTLPALFICTPYDKQESVWTKKAPNAMILNRISSLAKESLRVFEKQLYNGLNFYAESLFTTPLSEYDCLIRLKRSLNSRRFEALSINNDDNQTKVFQHLYREQLNDKMPIFDFDPVAEYLKELRTAFNNFALFFHDHYGGNIVGVLLKPNALLYKDFKVPNINCQKLDKDKLVLNVPAMLEDFFVLGKGLVESIDVQSQRLRLV